MSRYLLAFAVVLGAALPLGAAEPKEDAREVDFAKDIKPILLGHCAECHGPELQEGGLRLHLKQTAMRGGDSGKVIVPGKPSESELINRITADDESVRMPPAEDGKPLSPNQVALIKSWISQGAPWPEEETARLQVNHWAYQPVRDVQPPEVKNKAWVRNEIDRFVLSRLEEKGIQPSAAANRYALIKRAYYDLLGLPPTPEEVDAFLNDKSPQAWENLIDRLLASPHFGERWGRHWLDKARYADSDGYEKDRPRPHAWHFRDWVIGAVNADMPFDEFTIEQLAGDLLPDATREQKLATAFHRQTLTNTEGGVDQEEFRVAAVIDRVNTTGTVWLGITIGCAQCHSHKYDPFTQREYYELFAFFNSGDETNLEWAKSEQALAKWEQAMADHNAQVRTLQEKQKAARKRIAGELPAWEQAMQAMLAKSDENTIKFHAVEIASAESQQGAQLEQLKDGSLLAKGKKPDKDVYTITAKVELDKITGFLLEVLPHKSLGGNGPGRTGHGNFVLSEFSVSASGNKEFQQGNRVKLTSAEADFSQQGWKVEGAIDGKDDTGWAVSPQMGKLHEASFATDKPVGRKGTTWLKFELVQHYGSQHTIGHFRLKARTGHKPGLDLPAKVRNILAVAPEKRNDKQKSALLEYYLKQNSHYQALEQQLADLKKKAPKKPVVPVRVIAQRGNPRETHVFRRGDFLQPTVEVQPDTIEVLHAFEPREKKGMPDRLDLARWIVDPANPLTPRVAVNQMWDHLFGRGLVRSMNDFGVRGDKPTHPDLLDWLARQFVQRDWSRKSMIKLIMNSATYRQNSEHRPKLADVDPQNNLLYRQNRFRVEAEIIRDLQLAASGLLSRKLGGPSVFPPMPPDVAALSYANNFKWQTSKGEDRYRRGMYTFFKRTAPHPNLMSFDCPDANTTAVTRPTSNTPLQALITLNNDVFTEAAQALAKRLLSQKMDSDAERLAYGFRLCVARQPTQAELSHFGELLETSRQYYHEHHEDAKKMVGDHQPQDVPVDEAAAWAATTRILMNLDEFITRE